MHSPLTRAQQVYVWMAAIFLTSLIIANLIGGMLFSFELSFLKDPVLLSAGTLPFPITFLLTDLVNEFYGKKGARFLTLVGFVMSILVYVFLSIGEHLPVVSFSPLTHPQFLHISKLYAGMFIASLTAYLIGQLLDIQVFHVFRKITKHRYIWLRATGSTVVSQLFDSLLVTFIAFWGTQPADILMRLALGNYVWKFLIAVSITPLLYLGHGALNRLMPRQEGAVEALKPAYQEQREIS